MSETLFTKIRDREIDADFVYEDEELMAIRDINPQAPVHILIVPKEPIATTDDLTEAHEGLAGRMLRLASRVAREQGLGEDGYRLVLNTRAQGGQEIYHIHLHLLGGRQMTWPPG